MCGCCKACARELDGQEARQRGILDAVKEMIPLDLLLGKLYEISKMAFNSYSYCTFFFPLSAFVCTLYYYRTVLV